MSVAWSRGDVEKVVLLDAMGDGPCSVEALTAALGLGPDLAEAVEAAALALGADGWVEPAPEGWRRTKAGTRVLQAVLDRVTLPGRGSGRPRR